VGELELALHSARFASSAASSGAGKESSQRKRGQVVESKRVPRIKGLLFWASGVAGSAPHIRSLRAVRPSNVFRINVLRAMGYIQRIL
jgi:hypothetical protein